MGKFRYPMTGRVSPRGFAEFLESNLGPSRSNLKAFARELGEAFGVVRVSLVNSGSSANLAAALAFAERCPKGSHAVTAGFTFPTTLSSLLLAGFEVTIVDTEPGGFCIDPAAVRRAMRPNTRLVCATHFLGFPAKLDDLPKDIFILEDACETMGRRSSSGLTAWSFYHPHHLSSYGGGAVVCPDDDWMGVVDSIAHWGRACRCHIDPAFCGAPEGVDHNFWYVRRGQNLEMSELNACFGRFQLRTWREQEEIRRRHYRTLFDALRGLPVTIYPPPGGATPFAFPVTMKDSREIATRLLRRGVEVRSLMGGAIARHPAYRDVPNDGLVNCAAMSDASFLVGIHQTLADEDVEAVARILREEVTR